MWNLVFSNYLIFLLVFVRMNGMILLNPVFGRNNLPAQLKVGLAFFITLIVTNIIPYKSMQFAGVGDFIFACLKELFIGFAVSFIFQMYLSVIHLAGDIIDLQIGVGMTKIYDPHSQVSMPLTGSIFNLMYMLIFFAGNGHLTFIKIMALSFDIAPVGTLLFSPDFNKYIVSLFGNILVLAIKIAMPIIAIEIISEIGLGILMRTVPQINVFVVGLQLKLLIGLIVILIMLPGIANMFDYMTGVMFENINKSLNLAAG